MYGSAEKEEEIMPKTLALSLLCASWLVLGGCERSGSVEEAGEAIDDAVEEVGDRAEDVADEAEDLIEARGN
jgi:hypothetical protein